MASSILGLALTVGLGARLIPNELPAIFGDYVLLSSLGRGGMGEVFLAKKAGIHGIDRLCVLKTLRRDIAKDREYVGRFLDEARVVSQLNHANICHVLDVGEHAGTYFLAMEYIAGTDLRELTEACHRRGEPVDRRVGLYAISCMLDALDYAHTLRHPMTGEPLQVVHRDISPHNVMLGFDGSCALIDFGLAASTMKVERTESDVVLGKVGYMSPEQARGEPVDAASDQFAVGVMLYELLASERYYGRMSPNEIFLTVGERDYTPPSLQHLGEPWGGIIARATARDVRERYASCEAFRADVDRGRDALSLRAERGDARDLVRRVCAARIRAERDLLRTFADGESEGVERLLSGEGEALVERAPVERTVSDSRIVAQSPAPPAPALERTVSDSRIVAQSPAPPAPALERTVSDSRILAQSPAPPAATPDASSVHAVSAGRSPKSSSGAPSLVRGVLTGALLTAAAAGGVGWWLYSPAAPSTQPLLAAPVPEPVRPTPPVDAPGPDIDVPAPTPPATGQVADAGAPVVETADAGPSQAMAASTEKPAPEPAEARRRRRRRRNRPVRPEEKVPVAEPTHEPAPATMTLLRARRILSSCSERCAPGALERSKLPRSKLNAAVRTSIFNCAKDCVKNR